MDHTAAVTALIAKLYAIGYPDATDLSTYDLKDLIAEQYDGMAQLTI